MIYNGINFYDCNKEKTEAQFVKEQKHTGLTEDQLKEAYGLLNPKKKAKDDNKGATAENTGA